MSATILPDDFEDLNQDPTDVTAPEESLPSADEPDPFLDELLSDHDAVSEARRLWTALDADFLLDLKNGGPHDRLARNASLQHSLILSTSESPAEDIRQVLSICLDFLKGNKEAPLDETKYLKVTQTLALLSRDELWALAFTEHGLLDLYLDALQEYPAETDLWVDHAIRIVANCCTRSHRTKLSTFPRAPINRLVKGLAQKETAAMSAKAICAISSGLESAMEILAKQYRLTSILLDGVGNDYFEGDDIDVVLDLLEDMASFVDPQAFDDNQLTVLANLPYAFDVSDENVIVIGNLLVHLLQDSKSSSGIATQLHTLLRFFALTYSRPEYKTLMNGSPMIKESASENGTSQNKPLAQLRTNVITKCSQLAKSIDDIQIVKSDIYLLIRWITFSAPQVRIFGCVFLGNLAFHRPEHAEFLVRTSDLCERLRLCIEHEKDYSVLTSAFDLLQNIASQSNRAYLGQAGFLKSLSHRWQDINQFSGRALYHTRQLLHNCPENALLFLGYDSSGVMRGFGDSLLPSVLNAYTRMDDATIRAEIGKVVAEVWRTLETGAWKESHQPAKGSEAWSDNGALKTTSSESPLKNSEVTRSQREGDILGNDNLTQNETKIRTDVNEALEFHSYRQNLGLIFTDNQTAKVVEPILGLIKSENETLISQGWFTFSLMAQRREGATAIYKCCIEDDENFERLNETLFSHRTHPALRSNAQYVVATLQRQFKNDTDRGQRLYELLPGDQLVLHDPNAHPR